VAVDIAVATTVVAAITIAFTAAIAVVLVLSAAITVVVVAAVAAAAAAAAAADAATTMPSPLPPLSLSLQPLPMSLRFQRCQWLVVVSSVAPRLLCRPPSKFVSPPRLAVVNAFAAGPLSTFAYHRHSLSCCYFTEHQLPSLLPLMVGCCILRPPSSTPTTSPS